MTTTKGQSKFIADLNLKVVELISNELGINLADMITEHKNEASFIAASIKSIVLKIEQKDMKNESDLNALENQSTEQ